MFSCLNVNIYQSNTWKFENLNLNITNCFLPMTELCSTAGNQRVKVKISKGSFSKLSIEGKHKIVISNVTLTSNSGPRNSLLNVANSVMHMVNCTFSAIRSPTQAALLQAASSQISLENVRIENVQATTDLIHVYNSQLRIQKAHMSGNQIMSSNSMMLAKNTSAHISESVFRKNTCENGSIFHVLDSSAITIESSSFLQNVGLSFLLSPILTFC